MPAPDALDPQLADLERLVREVRPVPDEAATARLDRRVAVALAPGALRRPPRWRAALLPALGVAACALLVVVLALAGRGASPGTSASGGASGVSGGSASSAGSTAAPQSAGGVRAVERSTSLRLGAPARDLDGVASRAAGVATGLDGFVASSTITSGRLATLELRVPGERLDLAVERLSQLGRVRGLERSTLDITGELASARARVADARAERRSLLRRLAAADTDRAARHIRARLGTVTHRLERARAAVRRLRDRAGLATIDLTVTAERRGGAAPGSGGTWTPGDALHDAARILEVAAGVLVVALAVLLPAGAVAVVMWLAARWLTRHRRERALGPV